MKILSLSPFDPDKNEFRRPFASYAGEPRNERDYDDVTDQHWTQPQSNERKISR